MPSIDRLKELLVYEPDTGCLRWRVVSRKTKDGYAGCFRKDGYRMVRVDGVLMYAHRIVWAIHTGNMPNQFIDHINGDKLDNRIENLRDVSIATNSRNQRKARSDNQMTKMLGVQQNHSGWQACITTDGKRKCLGTYKSPIEAHQAYVNAKRKLHDGCTL